MRDKTASATWAASIGLGVAVGIGWEPAKVAGAVLFLVWLFFCALPWLSRYFRGGKRPGGEDA
jgi:uncharacterized membrane protein YhiD involved in acid resistance